MRVIVAMQDEFGALGFEDLLQMRAVAQGLAVVGLARQRRMMNEQDAVKALLAQFGEDAGRAPRVDRGPSEPPARRNDCGTAVDVPIRATLRRCRTKGKSAAL